MTKLKWTSFSICLLSLILIWRFKTENWLLNSGCWICHSVLNSLGLIFGLIVARPNNKHPYLEWDYASEGRSESVFLNLCSCSSGLDIKLLLDWSVIINLPSPQVHQGPTHVYVFVKTYFLKKWFHIFTIMKPIYSFYAFKYKKHNT